MNLQEIHTIYFSATGTTEKIIQTIAKQLQDLLAVPIIAHDITLPKARETEIVCPEHALVLAATPVYAGRIPNVMLPYWKNNVHGSNTPAVPIVLFGNRNYDDALIELRDVLQENGFRTVGGAAFVGEHSFSTTLAAGRPDSEDLQQAVQFARKLAQKLQSMQSLPQEPVCVRGSQPIRPYYTPRDRKGNPVNILKVKPKVNENCDNCGYCAKVCPMGSISPQDVKTYQGICIKCGACIKKCPKHARYYDDAGYLYHQHELEEEYQRRADNELFL